MDEQCSICKNYYEVCSTCKERGMKLKGCVEDKQRGWHDNGGYLPDADEKNEKYADSWIKYVVNNVDVRNRYFFFHCWL